MLFVNDKRSNVATPARERSVNGFSLFVKQQYASVKLESPKMSHAEVMSSLSERWKRK